MAKDIDPVLAVRHLVRDPKVREAAAKSIRTGDPTGLKVQQVAWVTWITNARKLYFLQALYAARLRHPELDGIDLAMTGFLMEVTDQYPDLVEDMDDMISELMDEDPASLFDNLYREQVEEYIAEILQFGDK